MQVPHIEIEEFATLPPDAVVIDVREPDEYEAGHVPGAMPIPLAEIPDRVGDIPAGRPVHVICQTGGRSLRASEFLINEGVDAVNVAGGTKAWVESGRDVHTSSGPRGDNDG